MAALRAAVLSAFVALVLVIAPSASAIVGGEVDTGHDYVVFVGQRVLWTHSSFPTLPGLPPNTIPASGQACSGTLVAPRVVVTAAHCSFTRPPAAFPNGAPFPQDATPTAVFYVVRQGDDAIVPGPGPHPYTERMGTMVVQSGFEFGGHGVSGFSNNDLAVVLLNGTLSGPFAQLPAVGASTSIQPKDALDAVGYGVSGMHGNTPIGSSFDGQRRRDSARLLGGRAFADDLLHYQAGTCFGDSGGALLDGDVLLGVVSFAPSGCKSTNYATRVDTADSLAFIGAFLGA